MSIVACIWLCANALTCRQANAVCNIDVSYKMVTRRHAAEENVEPGLCFMRIGGCKEGAVQPTGHDKGEGVGSAEVSCGRLAVLFMFIVGCLFHFNVSKSRLVVSSWSLLLKSPIEVSCWSLLWNTLYSWGLTSEIANFQYSTCTYKYFLESLMEDFLHFCVLYKFCIYFIYIYFNIYFCIIIYIIYIYDI